MNKRNSFQKTIDRGSLMFDKQRSFMLNVLLFCPVAFREIRLFLTRIAKSQSDASRVSLVRLHFSYPVQYSEEIFSSKMLH